MKFKDLEKMNNSERKKRLKELKLELIKSQGNASKTKGARIKEIKKRIAQIIMLNKNNGNMSKVRSA